MTHAVESGLGRLIETEIRLAETVAAAEREAAALIAAAREASEASATESRVLLDTALDALTRRVAAGRDAELAEVVRRAEERCRRLRALPAEVSAELAAWVEQRVLAPDDGPDSP
jgi:hypothetical protein